MPSSDPIPNYLRSAARRLQRAVGVTARPGQPTTLPAAPRSSTTSSPRPESLGTRLDDADAPRLLRRMRHVTVIVPIFNAAAELSRCLESLARNSPLDAEFVLIDDASTDPAVAVLLAEFAEREPRARLLENAVNRGFTATANRGLAATSGDVVLLNSDTEVPPRWLDNLQLAAYQSARIGTVTPLSDNSGAFSAPVRDQRNEVPSHLSRDDIGRLVSQSSARRYPRSPTGGGFCLYIKRVLLDSVGHLDEDAFPRGYGEENDLCARGSEAGWEHVVDDATYVFHVRGSSFGSEKTSLMEAGRAAMRQRHPNYEAEVGSFLRREDLQAVHADVRRAFDEAPEQVRPRVLTIVHAAGGGTPATTRDLALALRDSWDVWILECDGSIVRLLRLNGETWTSVQEARLASPISFGQRTDATYRRFAVTVLTEYAFELIHIRHLIKHPLDDVTDLAVAFGIPFLVSFHDYYFSCPTIHLLDHEDRFCAGRCTAGQGLCLAPMNWISSKAPHLKHAWVYVWRDGVTRSFAHASGFVSASEATRQIIQDNLPGLADRPFTVIEHGRDLEHSDVAEAPTPGAPIRVLVPGHLIGKHKGVHLLRALKQADRLGRLDLHLLGQAPEDLAEIGTLHGAYARGEFLERARQIAPSLALILSPWGETYCHTLTESWSAGLPVIAADAGALRERITANGGGVLVGTTDMESVLATIVAVADAPETYERLHADVLTMQLRTAAEMARDYDRLYREQLL